MPNVNCRVGSLEINGKISNGEYSVNCRVGSLEIINKRY